MFGDEAEVRIMKVLLPRTGENVNRLFATCALVNVYMVRKKLLYGVA